MYPRSTPFIHRESVGDDSCSGFRPATDQQNKKSSKSSIPIDRKIDLHRRKRVVLEELFKALLHKLMTGEIGVRELNHSVTMYT